MRVKIYQVNAERDKHDVKFFRLETMQKLQGSPEIDSSIYDEVFNAELEESTLEEIFQKFNQEWHPLYRGHSLSVSDIVVKEDCAYFCQPVGFEKVDFQESLAYKPDNLMKVVYVEPHRPPYTAEVENTLKGQQRAVGGLIQYLYNEDNTIIVINDEGKLNGLEGNRRIEGDVLCGSSRGGCF